VITTLMCNEEIRWQELAEQLQMSVEQIQAMTAYSEERMQRFAEDGLILFDREGIVMREKGSPYVRTVAASLDPLLIHSDKTFSKPI
jgi:oxygen-independent coproporphyrinogen-3 oxidase